MDYDPCSTRMARSCLVKAADRREPAHPGRNGSTAHTLAGLGRACYYCTATAGDLIGEGALIGTAPHTLTAVAMGPLSLLRIEPRHFAALCAIASPWHRRIVHHLALRLAQAPAARFAWRSRSWHRVP